MAPDRRLARGRGATGPRTGFVGDRRDFNRDDNELFIKDGPRGAGALLTQVMAAKAIFERDRTLLPAWDQLLVRRAGGAIGESGAA